MHEDIDTQARKLLEGIDPSCQSRGANNQQVCTAEASWLLRVSCGDGSFLCDQHRESWSEGVEAGKPLYCAKHGPVGTRYDWVRLGA